jgi:predicted GIY-YIG superfamily endonuclease
MRGPVRFGAYVYMLECADGSYYVGLTRHQYLETRISEHEQA